MRKITPFGRFVRTKRMERGLLLIEMAEAVGVRPSMMSMAELGERKVPWSWLDDIADFLRLSTEEKESLEKTIERTNEADPVEWVSTPYREAAWSDPRKSED
ncbi:MAG: helix-turn-helix transcriptional regulator [Pseudomonadota bacterium]